jgi:uncharacterized protein involved in outer membrane biogenesis
MRLSKLTKRVLLALGALVLLVAVGEIVGWPFLRGPIERKMSETFERPVALGPGFRIRFIGSVRVRADTIAVGPPAWDTAPTQPSPFVDATATYVVVPYATLWNLYRKSGAPLYLRTLEVDDLKARLVREAGGRANWALLPDTGEPKAATPIPTFERLVLRSGHVVLNDALTAVKVDAKVRTDEGSGTGANPSASAAAASSSGAQAPGAGLVVEGSGSYKGNPLTFHVESEGVLPLLATDEGATPVRLAFDARAGQSRVKFDGKAVDVFRLTGVDGSYEVAGPSLAAIGDAIGVTLPTTAAFAIEGLLKKQGKLYTTQVRRLSVGTSRLGGQFNFDTAPETPLLTGELNGQRLALADLGPAIGAGIDKGAPNPPPPPGKVLPQREFDLPSLRLMDADVRVRLAHADFGSELLQPFAPLEAQVVLQRGVLSLKNVVARTSGGELSGNLQLDSTPAQPKFGADIRWSGIRLEQWLKLGNPRDRQAQEGGRPPPYVTGNVLGAAKLQGSGRSTARIVGSLSGTITTAVRQGSVSHLAIEAMGLDVAQALGTLLKGDETLKMDCALLRLTAREGAVTTDMGVVDTSDTTVLLTGGLSLADERLALRLTAKPKDFSPLTLRAPLNVAGSFADPTVRPEAKALSMKLLAAAVLAAVNPWAAVLPLMDMGDKEDSAACEVAVARLRKS